jgi:hypothetical protein
VERLATWRGQIPSGIVIGAHWRFWHRAHQLTTTCVSKDMVVAKRDRAFVQALMVKPALCRVPDYAA